LPWRGLRWTAHLRLGFTQADDEEDVIEAIGQDVHRATGVGGDLSRRPVLDAAARVGLTGRSSVFGNIRLSVGDVERSKEPQHE